MFPILQSTRFRTQGDYCLMVKKGVNTAADEAIWEPSLPRTIAGMCSATGGCTSLMARFKAMTSSLKSSLNLPKPYKYEWCHKYSIHFASFICLDFFWVSGGVWQEWCKKNGSTSWLYTFMKRFTADTPKARITCNSELHKVKWGAQKQITMRLSFTQYILNLQKNKSPRFSLLWCTFLNCPKHCLLNSTKRYWVRHCDAAEYMTNM